MFDKSFKERYQKGGPFFLSSPLLSTAWGAPRGGKGGPKEAEGGWKGTEVGERNMTRPLPDFAAGLFLAFLDSFQSAVAPRVECNWPPQTTPRSVLKIKKDSFYSLACRGVKPLWTKKHVAVVHSKGKAVEQAWKPQQTWTNQGLDLVESHPSAYHTRSQQALQPKCALGTFVPSGFDCGSR